MLTFKRLTWWVVPMLWAVLTIGVGDLHCFAQTAGVAQISGIIRDPSGAPISGAQIKITQVETKQDRQITSDDQGRYMVPALPVGPYQLEVSAAGFKAYIQTGIVLQVGNNVDINVSMQIGATSERIDVTAQANMVETRENAISQVIDERRIVELPLNGRQPTQLILLAGASVTAPASDLATTKNIYSSTTISVAGGQGNGVNYMLDGADNNDAMTNVNLPIPFPDALQEFSVQTSSLPARFGLHPAAVVNAVTKSGTNDWHGDLFEFLRNGNLNARNFFAPVHDSLKRNQFGGTFGGRIIRDKLFFFGGFQGTINRSNPPQSVAFVPTAAVLNGDFSVIDGPGCVSGGKGRTIIDPITGLPFNNNQIPVNRFDAASLTIAKSLPAAQNGCGQVTYGIPTTGDDDQEIGRVDWLQSSKHTVYGRYYIVDYRNPAIFNAKNIITSGTIGNVERTQSVTLGDTYSFSGSLLNSAHATFTRRRDDRNVPPNVPDAAGVGIGGIAAGVNPNFLPVTGYFTIGSNGSKNSIFNGNSFSFFDDVDVVWGKHQIAFGVNLMRNQFNVRRANGATFSFNGQYATGKSVGDPLAAFMLGAMDSFHQDDVQQEALRQTVVGMYVQDSIRLTSHLTVNVGLRWDPALSTYDYFNHGSGFSRAAFNAGQRSTVFQNAPAGTLFYGDSGIPRGFQNSPKALFSPRLGIVWDPTGSGRQTIRISGAILRDTQMIYYKDTIMSKNAPYGTQIIRPFPFPSGTFSNPWGGYPGGSPFPLPSPVPSNFVFPNGTSMATLPPDLKPTYMAQWSLSYQRQITPNWLASASYLGNKTTHRLTGQDINPAVYIPGSTANPNLRRVLFLQNPTLGAAYSQVIESDQGGNANYNALLLSIQHRFSHGFTWLTNYTWSHCLSDVDAFHSLLLPDNEIPNNRAADYGNCNFDIRHVTNTSLIAISPVKGKGLVGRVFGQWQLAPIVSMRSGLPINVIDGADISQTGIGLDRPNLVLGCNPYASTGTAYLNRACFQTQAAGTFGNLARAALFAPGAINFDMSLSRTFRFNERWQLTPRAEAFNVINHTNFVAPVSSLPNGSTAASLASTQFGVLTAAGDPRILQFSLKLQF